MMFYCYTINNFGAKINRFLKRQWKTMLNYRKTIIIYSKTEDKLFESDSVNAIFRSFSYA